VEKFDGKSNFLLWKMRLTSLLVKEGTHKALLSIEKPSKIEDDEWGMTSSFTQRRRSYYTHKTKSSITS